MHTPFVQWPLAGPCLSAYLQAMAVPTALIQARQPAVGLDKLSIMSCQVPWSSWGCLPLLIGVRPTLRTLNWFDMPWCKQSCTVAERESLRTPYPHADLVIPRWYQGVCLSTLLQIVVFSGRGLCFILAWAGTLSVKHQPLTGPVCLCPS